jgi:hypothetical protein
MTKDPAQVLQYATKHNYADLTDLVAPLTLSLDFQDAYKIMDGETFRVWVRTRYYVV